MTKGSNQQGAARSEYSMGILCRNVNEVAHTGSDVPSIDVNETSSPDDVENMIARVRVHGKTAFGIEPNKIAA